MSISTQVTVVATAEQIIVTAPGALRGPMGDVTPEVTALVAEAGAFSESSRLSSVASQEYSEDSAQSAAAAREAMDAAEDARDVAQNNAGIKDSVADGIASGLPYFWTISPEPSEVLALYKNTDGVAVDTGERTPSAEAVRLAQADSADLRAKLSMNGLAIYKGPGPDFPLATDLHGRQLLRWNVDEGRWIGPGILTIKDFFDSLAGKNVANYIGSGPIFPVLRDKNGRVLLGYDATQDKIIGAGLSAAGGGASFQPLTQIPLVAALRPIAKAVNHYLFYGQSLATGATALPILSTTQPYSNTTFAGGPRGNGDLLTAKPLVEDAISPAPDGGTNRGETPCSGAANYASLIGAKRLGAVPSSHVIFSSTAAHGGYRISLLKKGSAWYQQVIDQVVAAKAINPDYAVHSVAWMQGENDAVTGGVQTPYATYRAELEQLQIDLELDIKSITGQVTPVFMVTYQMTYGAATWPDIAKAHLDLAQKNPKFFLSTPMYQFPYSPDNVHLTNVGSKWVGAYFGRAYERLVMEGVQPQWVNPVSAMMTGTSVRVRFSVPYPPLVLDTIKLAMTADYGFRVRDASGTVPITSVVIEGGDTVVIALSRVTSGAVVARYALDYIGSGITVTGGASGNLRDSDPEVVTIGGASRPLFNICPHFEIGVIPNNGI